MKNITQDVLANYLELSFQAVSKWETGSTMPDVGMISAIASFFGVSTDELFDFHVYEIEKEVRKMVDEHSLYWYTDKKKAEEIIRNGLKRYPGNDVLLNCLIGVLDVSEQGDEMIAVAKALVESTKDDEVRFDAYRIMAEALMSRGEYQSAKDTMEHIPEIYFTKLEVAAFLLEGEEKYEAAQKQKNLSATSLIDMLLIIGKYLSSQGKTEKTNAQFNIAKKIMDAFADDFLESKWFKSTLFEPTSEQRLEVEKLLNK